MDWTIHRRFRWTLLASLAVLLSAAPAAAESPPPGAKPFPTNKSRKLRAKDGPVFYIDGPTVIPKKVEITVQLDVQIVGIHGATLDVQGGLKVHGTQDHWVKITNVDFSPTRSPHKGFHLDMVDLSGVTFVHPEGEAVAGTFVIENGSMQRDCAFDFRIQQGALKLMTIDSGIPWAIHCTPPEGKKPDIELQIRSSWARDLKIDGPCDATVRHCELKNGLVVRNFDTFVLDGCDVTVGSVAFHQAGDRSFKGLTLTKCNLYEGSTLILDRPAGSWEKKEKVKVDKFFFGPKGGGKGTTKKDAVAALVDDGVDKPERLVTAVVAKPSKKEHKLVAYSQLRLRVPQVR